MDGENSATGRFGTFRFAAVWAAGISTVCVLIGQGAEKFAIAAKAPPVEVASAHTPASGAKPIFNAIDYATTSAIRGQTVVIAPCQR